MPAERTTDPTRSDATPTAADDTRRRPTDRPERPLTRTTGSRSSPRGSSASPHAARPSTPGSTPTTSAPICPRVDGDGWRPAVYAFPASPDIWERRLWIAHLHAGPDSAGALGSAARWSGLHPVEGYPVELHVPRTATRALPGTIRHRPRDLDPSHVEVVRGLPVTTPERTIVDLAAHLSQRRLQEMIQNAAVEGQCTVVAVATMLDSLRRPGKRGVRALGRALDHVGPGGALPRSELEALLDQVIELSGLPAPLHEQPLPSFGGIVGFVDRTWPDARLIVEADGRRWHTRQQDIARDHDRTVEAARHGYLTLRFVWERLRNDPLGTAQALVEIHDGRLRDLAGR